MTDRRAIDELKALGAGRPAPEAVVALYREAFARFGTQALWSRAPSAAPTLAQALVVAQGLRNEGNMRARLLAAMIEDACRAALQPAAEVLHALAAHRNPESYVAGGSVLNRDGPRVSQDINIFHDREASVAA